MKIDLVRNNRKALFALLLCSGFIATHPLAAMASNNEVQATQQSNLKVSGIVKVGSINSIFYFLHKAAEPFNCLEQDNLA